jgi:hypothetical protein
MQLDGAPSFQIQMIEPVDAFRAASSSSAASNTVSASAGWVILPAAFIPGATPKATSREFVESLGV